MVRTPAVFVLAAAILHMLLACLGPVRPAEAASPPKSVATSAEPIALKRDILGLYDSTTETSAKTSRLHRLLEMPLNHLGYRLTLHDISAGLPPLPTLARYRAVATWFSDEIKDGRSYLQWAAKAARGGTRFVVIDSPGLLGGEGELPVMNAFLGELGIAYADYFVSEAKETKVLSADSAMIDFEAKLKPEAMPGHQVVLVRGPAIDVHLSVTDPAHQLINARSSALVTTGPRGGHIASGFAVEEDTERHLTRWFVNPFAFLEAALGGGIRPIPDTTTISGRRIYFSHIDGDGWNNASSVPPYADRRAIAATVMLERLIAPYPDLPVTVGLIAGDADPSHGGSDQGAEVARRIYRLPQVEPASHTYTHPYQWSFFEQYDRPAEIARVLKFADVKPEYDDRNLSALIRHWRSQAGPPSPTVQPGQPAPAATEPPRDPAEAVKDAEEDAVLPRSRPELPFNLETEVKGALLRTTRLAPQQKPPKLYQWSGDTTPFEAVVRATREAGVRNINGGDSRFDQTYPSVAYVPPIGIAVGAERQIYAVNSNENTYTNGWSGPYDAFKQLTETLDNTERPRRLKGFNLYYHAFSATRPEGVDTIAAHLERARAEPVTPIKASHYAALAEGFYSAEVVPIDGTRWRIANRGALDTMRFDSADHIMIEYARSTGIVGHRHYQGSLYVALDPAVPEPVIAVQPALVAAASSSAMPHLVDSRWLLSDVDRTACAIKAKAQGFGPAEFTWGGMAPGRYEIMASRNERVLHKLEMDADGNGQLAFRLPLTGLDPIALSVACTVMPERVAAQPAVAPAAPSVVKKASPSQRPRANRTVRPKAVRAKGAPGATGTESP